MKTKAQTKVFKHIGEHDCLLLIGPLAISPEELNRINNFETPKIAVDGGLNHPIKGALSIGDGDSSGIPCDISFPPNKDYSDLKGLLDLLPHHLRQIQAYGFIGGRLDHQLGVIGEMLRFSELSKTQVSLFGDSYIEILPPGKSTLQIHGTFSIISIETTKINLSGKCEFSGENIDLSPLSSRAISNVGHGEITFSCPHPLAVFHQILE